jgi:hypothetical protein
MPKTHKEIFIARLMHERDKFELLLNRVGYTRMTLKAFREVVHQDMLALILPTNNIRDRMHGPARRGICTRRTQNALDAFLDEFGYPDFGSPLLDDDGPNEWVTEKYKNVALDDVVMQEIQAFSSIISYLETMTEEVMNRHHFMTALPIIPSCIIANMRWI